eukprot:1831348-Pyramimonas_sp.AAC.1
MAGGVDRFPQLWWGRCGCNRFPARADPGEPCRGGIRHPVDGHLHEREPSRGQPGVEPVTERPTHLRQCLPDFRGQQDGECDGGAS